MPAQISRHPGGAGRTRRPQNRAGKQEWQMPLSLVEVEHVAELARLSLTAEEKALFREQLSAILDYAAVLQDVDTSAIPPTATVLPLQNVMRDDVARPSLPQADVLANAPDARDGFFAVRQILQTQSQKQA
jgi:aspartyl-tRNA(Asn)/glutamyl-tRNA(Gln) amidotransferase subunit C